MNSFKPLDFQERITFILESVKLKPAAFAKEVGVTRPSVVMWKNGTTNQMKPEQAYAIEDRFGFSARWILTGEGPQEAVMIQEAKPIYLSKSPLLLALERLTPKNREKIEQAIITIIETLKSSK